MNAKMMLIGREDAWAILRWFWPNLCPPPHRIDEVARSLAQDVMIQAIARSADPSYIQARYQSFYLRPTRGGDRLRRTVDETARRLAGRAPLHWFRGANPLFLREPEIQESVRSTIAKERASELLRILSSG